MRPWLLLAGLLGLMVAITESARILAVLPLPGKSHYILLQSITEALAKRGHQVTMYSSFKPDKPVPNMNHIEIHTKLEQEMLASFTFDKFKEIVDKQNYFGFGSFSFWAISYPMCEEFLQHEKIQQLLKSKEKYDLVIAEAFFGQESLFALGHLLNAPVINVNSFGPWSVLNHVHGNDLQIASQPDIVSFPFTNKMNFVERFRNTVSTVGSLLLWHFYHLPQHQAIMDRVFPGQNIPPLEDLVVNVSLSLANFHSSVGYAQAITPNIIPVGGIHVKTDVAPLPKDLKEFMDSGKNAVIYFSMGSLIPVHMMPSSYLQTFIKVFSKLPYKVLWKLEEDIAGLPKNVKTVKWAPQQSVLAHPNCVLFITHGGLLSQYEVFQAGVPVVGVPFFGDQPYNVRLYEELGIGTQLDFNTLTEQSMTQAILSVVGKPKFLENAKRVSEQFRHRVMTPADTAVFWTEYVLRHGGARHLRPHSALMPWYSLYLVDIVVAILAAIFLVLFIVKKILGFLFGLCCGKKVKKDVVTSKKKKN